MVGFVGWLFDVAVDCTVVGIFAWIADAVFIALRILRDIYGKGKVAIGVVYFYKLPVCGVSYDKEKRRALKLEDDRVNEFSAE